MLRWYQDMSVAGKERKDMLQWYSNVVQDYRGIQARSGAYVSSPDAVWMMKLCPGHIACPPTSQDGAGNPLGISASRGIAVDCRTP
jgi:hypothetical protein